MGSRELIQNRLRWLIVFALALLLYIICLDPGASLWDCPEYILIAWRLEIGHPPGNPTWQLAANALSHLGASAEHAAVIINAMSAVAMALASAFLSSSAFLLLRGSLLSGAGRSQRSWANLCAAAGALCYAWCDSAIFSAVEAEVYALSAFFTSLMLYLALQWARQRSRGNMAKARRLLILIAYLAGLGIGVHELNFLILPAILLIYIYGIARFPLRAGKSRVSVNFATMATALWSLLFFMLGSTTYLLIPLRAAAMPPVNQGEPKDAVSFYNYYTRQQYGSTPLLHGRTPYSRPLRLEKHDSLTGKYSYNTYYLTQPDRFGNRQVVYPSELDMWFPRLTASRPSDIRFFEAWAGMTPENMVEVEFAEAADSCGNPVAMVNEKTGLRTKGKALRPTYAQQLRYFAAYQIGYMYFRYLLWNFAGRQNNIHSTGEAEHGNFITGIPPLDNAMLGDQSALPPNLRENNPGYNRYFMIPLFFGIFGIIALIAAGKRGRRVCAIIAVFFLFTGLLIVVYLNQSPGEARERDYSFLGSYMAFALWIACGLAALVRLLLGARPKRRWMRPVAECCALLVCVGVPLQMLSQTYDDHNRSGSAKADKYARQTFAMLEPDAIIFAYGDNQIFPLWYGQEVLGLRRDVKVVAMPYLVTDWYRRQLSLPGEESKALNVPDSIPRGTGSQAERVRDAIILLNPDRPVYDANKLSEERKVKDVKRD